jgi:hypothetical protein
LFKRKLENIDFSDKIAAKNKPPVKEKEPEDE